MQTLHITFACYLLFFSKETEEADQSNSAFDCRPSNSTYSFVSSYLSTLHATGHLSGWLEWSRRLSCGNMSCWLLKNARLTQWWIIPCHWFLIRHTVYHLFLRSLVTLTKGSWYSHVCFFLYDCFGYRPHLRLYTLWFPLVTLHSTVVLGNIPLYPSSQYSIYPTGNDWEYVCTITFSYENLFYNLSRKDVNFQRQVRHLEKLT